MKKLLATVVALSCATVMLLGTAFAGAFTDGIGDGQVEAGEAWTYEIPTDSVANLDQTASVRITFTASSLEAGFGGGFIFNTSGAGAAGNNWNSKEWGNADAAKEISAVETGNDLEFTITRDDAAGLFGTTEDQYGVYNKVCLQSWWGADIDVTKIELLDASGNTIYSAPAGSTTTPDDGEGEGGTTEPTPVTGDVMNIVMIAGVAVVALGGVVVCARKKNA